MITSMTGYGHGAAGGGGINASVDLRTVNSRFLEVSARLPRTLALREGDVREMVRKRLSRGKVTCTVTVERESLSELPLRVNLPAARAYHTLLNELRKGLRLRESVKLEHLLRFPDILEGREAEGANEAEWGVASQALAVALDGLQKMRAQEGGEIAKDFSARIALMEGMLDRVEELSRAQVPQERQRLRERIRQILESESVDEGRLELEIALIADRLDVTEECVRFRSHNKFFLAAMGEGDPAGRRLNFLVQEMNREANTIGSKSSSPEIAHLVVHLKEELEKIREQVQNVE
ncbi:MAG: YicC/YloC family endoribonuclease [Bacteroidota bacterium]